MYRVVKWAVNDDLTASDDLKTGCHSAHPHPSPPQPTSPQATAPARLAWSCLGPHRRALRTTRSIAPRARSSPGHPSSARPPRRATRTPPSSWTPFTRTGSQHHPHPQHPRSQRLTPGLLSRGGANSITFTGSATWVVPSGVTSLTGCVVYGKGGDGGNREYQLWVPPGRMLRVVAAVVVSIALAQYPSLRARRFQSLLTRRVPQSCAEQPHS